MENIFRWISSGSIRPSTNCVASPSSLGHPIRLGVDRRSQRQRLGAGYAQANFRPVIIGSAGNPQVP